MQKIGLLTSGRQDWGILRSTAKALGRELYLIAGGMHLRNEYGATVRNIIEDGFEVDARAAFTSFPEAAASLHKALAASKVSALVLVGDRWETCLAAQAATLLRIPIIHLHGGEETAGAVDNQFRHAITKMAHLHLVSCDAARKAVIAMGEDPSSVVTVGSPGVDNALRDDLADREELEDLVGSRLRNPVVIISAHSATLGEDPASLADALVGVMDQVEATYVAILPNDDSGSDVIRRKLVISKACTVQALSERCYWGLMVLADAIIGNSSSGVIEAPAIGLPSVVVGDRQKGRLPKSIKTVEPKADAVAQALRGVLDKPRGRGRSIASPVGPLIADIIRNVRFPSPPQKALLRPRQS